MKTTFVFPSTPVFVANNGKPIAQFYRPNSVVPRTKKPRSQLTNVVHLRQLFITKLSFKIRRQ